MTWKYKRLKLISNHICIQDDFLFLRLKPTPAKSTKMSIGLLFKQY